jgi:hypothetical protein
MRRQLNLEQLEDRVTPATIAVTNTLDDGSAGSLRAAIVQANSDAANGVSDTIQFNSSLASATIVLSQGQLELRSAGGTITIDGSALSTPVTISGNHASRVFLVDAGVQAVFDSLNIVNGIVSDDHGGGVDNSGTLTLKNSSISGNSAFDGGGINSGGTLTVNNCTFTGNNAVEDGGGFADVVSGTQSFTHCTFANNSALNGGGINSGGSLTVSDSAFTGNAVGNYGGGISASNQATISNSSFSGNAAGGVGIFAIGGGINFGNGTLIVSNCIVSNNTASIAGGGIETSNSVTTINGCTVTGNTAVVGSDIDTGVFGLSSILNVSDSVLSSLNFSNGSITFYASTTAFAQGAVTAFRSEAIGIQSDDDGNIIGTTVVTIPNTFTLNLTSSNYTDLSFNLQPGITAIVNGVSGSTTIVGHSPALTVLAGNVIVNNVTFTTATDAPTILVAGGSLALRNDVVQESTGFADAAIAVTGSATVDLGSTTDPGNNTININGAGQLVQNTTSTPISTAGNTFESGGTVLPAALFSSTAVTSSAATTTLNQAVTFTVTVQPGGTGTPSGTVDFFDVSSNTDLGSVALSGGTASITTTALPAGSNNVQARYSGDATFLPSLGSTAVSVLYKFSGFLAPLNSNMAMALNRTVPIKFQLTDYNEKFINSLGAVQSLVVSGGTLSALRYDSTANQFIANWQTKGLAAGTYTVTLVLADGTIYTKTVTLSKTGSASGLTTTAAGGTTTAVGALLGGDIDLYVDNTNGDLTADELARIQDAVTAANGVTAPYGVAVMEVTDPTLADVTLNMDTTSAVGGYAAGVLGCTTDAGQITIINGLNFYAGSDATQIAPAQYDFETVVEHELGHALGLGHSTDSTSVMYATLNTGTVNRTLTTADLNIADTDTTGACGLHAAIEVGRVSNPSYDEAGRDLLFAFAGTALGELPVGARSETRAEQTSWNAAPVDAVFVAMSERPIFAGQAQRESDDSQFDGLVFPDSDTFESAHRIDDFMLAESMG